MKFKSDINTCNSGIVSIGTDKKTKTKYGGQINVKSIGDLANVHRFFFEELSKRERDYLTISALGHSLSMKIKIPFNTLVKSKQYAIIGKDLFTILYIDHDKCCENLYLYLESVTKDE